MLITFIWKRALDDYLQPQKQGLGTNLQHIYITVWSDKPLARLIVVRRLGVDKGQVLRSGMLDTPFINWHVRATLPDPELYLFVLGSLKEGRWKGRLFVEAWTYANVSPFSGDL